MSYYIECGVEKKKIEIVSSESIIKQQADGCNATSLLQKSQWSHFGSVNSCQIFPFFFPASSVGAAGQSLPVALLQMMQFDRNHMKSLVLATEWPEAWSVEAALNGAAHTQSLTYLVCRSAD